ncbi:response regulator [candidate division KSB1 bacterium]|nr:response regulator [candidate division KSB1 bacterium]
MNKSNSIPILLVEDDEDNVLILKRALQKCNVTNPLYIAADGEDAYEFLTHTGAYENSQASPRPGLIFLDLNMPRMDGRELLKKIKSDPSLQFIPTVVLTTSKYERDMQQTYNIGANSYITKPINFQEFVDMIGVICEYWLAVVEIPMY